MPIRPENRVRYPANWAQISASIRERAQHRCEWPGCGAQQYAVGRWELCAGIWIWCQICGNGSCCEAGTVNWPSGQRWTYKEAQAFADLWVSGVDKPIVIVLTIAHLDHTPENCDPANLRAWCQRHHLAYDAKHHVQTAYMARRAACKNLELPL